MREVVAPSHSPTAVFQIRDRSLIVPPESDNFAKSMVFLEKHDAITNNRFLSSARPNG